MADDDEFYLILPSNSSMKYFSDNTTSCFTTHLSHEVRLHGNWSVALTEIHIPCTMMCIQKNECNIKFAKGRRIAIAKKRSVAEYLPDWTESSHIDTSFPAGVYDNLNDLADAINNIPESHLRIEQSKKKRGYYSLSKRCECKEAHFFSLSDKVKRIFGFENEKYRMHEFIPLIPTAESKNATIVGNRPACLARGITDQFFVYSDVCIPYTIGDVQASLLRIVTLDNSKYTFGATIVKQFAPGNYIPLLNNTFQNIIIDIRDQNGNHVPFEYGTLTVTLHFKRIR